MALFGSPKWHSYVNIPVRLCFYTDRLMATASVRLSSFGLRQDDPVGDVGRLFAKTIRWLILADLAGPVYITNFRSTAPGGRYVIK